MWARIRHEIINRIGAKGPYGVDIVAEGVTSRDVLATRMKLRGEQLEQCDKAPAEPQKRMQGSQAPQIQRIQQVSQALRGGNMVFIPFCINSESDVEKLQQMLLRGLDG